MVSAKPGRGGIVGDCDRTVPGALGPLGKVKPIPAWHLERLQHDTRPRIHGATKANPNRSNIMPRCAGALQQGIQQWRQRGKNAGGAMLRLHAAALQAQYTAISAAERSLQLGAADLDANTQRASKLRNFRRIVHLFSDYRYLQAVRGAAMLFGAAQRLTGLER